MTRPSAGLVSGAGTPHRSEEFLPAAVEPGGSPLAGQAYRRFRAARA